MTLTAPDTQHTTTEPPKRRWPMIAASVAAVAVVGALVAVAGNGDNEVDPVDEPAPTIPEPDPLPEEAEGPTAVVDGGVAPLPVANETSLAAGRYSTDLLGIDLEFDVPDNIEGIVLTSARAGMIQFADGYPDELTSADDYTLDRAVTVSFQRFAGWSTPEEATLSAPDAASIPPGAVDAWIEQNAVNVVDDRKLMIDGRSVRALEVTVDEPESIAPGGCVDVEWQCTYYGATAEPAGRARSRQDALTVSPFRETRFWVIPTFPAIADSGGQEGAVPLLVTATGPEGSGEYLDAFADGVVATMTFEGDKAPIGWDDPLASEDADAEPTESGDDGSATNQANEDATELLDGWVAAWNAGDADAVAALFLPDAVLITSDGIERSGERAGTYIAGFVPRWPTLARTTDGQPNDDGTISFNIEWTSPSGTIVPRTLDITTSDGSLVLMNERFTPDN